VVGAPDTVLKFRIFDALDGIQVSTVSFQPRASRFPDRRLWFANENILQMIDPDHLAANPIVPPVHSEGITADKRNYLPREDLRLPALTRDLEIDYTGLSFVIPQKVRFRYKLEGHDADLQDPGTRRQAFYADLRPGNYRFRLVACNGDGVWNNVGAMMNFTVAS
jgi:hypothetical protein